MVHESLCRTLSTAALLAVMLLYPAGSASAQDTLPKDSGRFMLSIQESEIGFETFTSDADGSVADETITIGSQKATVHIITKATHGRLTWVTVEAKPGGNYDLTIEGEHGEIKYPGAQAATKEVTLPAHPVLFGNFAPHFAETLLAAYDVTKGGSQKFDTLLVENGLMVPMTLTSTGATMAQVAGKTIPITRYVLTASGPIGNIDIEIKADPDGRLLMWNIPAQKYVAVRDGYQDLLKPAGPVDPTLSQPAFTVKKETGVKIAMRDGVSLIADVYRPDAPGHFPVILQRTPYGRDKAFEATYYARRGYVFVAQDVRGKFASEGDWQPFVNEGRDGYDSVAWCAAQPWSDGSVGMIGASYLGFVQWAAAGAGAEHLKCLIPIVSPPDPFYNLPYAFGPLFLWPDLWWTAIAEGKGMNAIPKMTEMKPFRTLPLSDVDKAVLGHHVPFFQEWLHHPNDDSYWQQVDFLEKLKTIGPLPVLNVSGWFDGDGIGTKLNYAAMVGSAHANQKLIYGPWTHAINSTTKLGPLDFGPQSLRDLDTLYLRWFDHWLKGVDNGIDREPPVDAFLMGSNQWRTFSAWPPKEAIMTKWYFRSAGHANADRSNGRLTTELPKPDETVDHYTYDPDRPFIPVGFDEGMKGGDVNNAQFTGKASRDPQLLVYSSAPLSHEVTVAGPLSIHLTASSSARDTDWFAMLEDVGPDNRGYTLCSGIIRARYRHSASQPEWLTPDTPEQYDIDMWAIGNVFKKGHRIRISVSSSCFPLYARNLNTGEDDVSSTKMVTAQQTVLHDSAHLSYIVLPTLQ